MFFVKQIGERYLWIDRYCVVRDNPKEKHAQIQAMGIIYRQSFFTIIAADGSSTTGIPGLREYNDWDIRRSQQPIAHGSGFDLFATVQYHDVTFGTPWATRGWTYQEQVLARRCIIFRGEQIFFSCEEGVFQEGMEKPSTQDWFDESVVRKILRDDILKLNHWPNLDTYITMTEVFQTRSFTFPCDSLFAFSGVLQILRHDFPGGFFFGLPEVYFSIALLWQKDKKANTLEDRKFLAMANRQPTQTIPSWSWLRWQGSINFLPWHSNWDAKSFLNGTIGGFPKPEIIKLTPCVAWYKIGEESRLKERIRDDYYYYRDNPLLPASAAEITALLRARLTIRVGGLFFWCQGPELQYLIPLSLPGPGDRLSEIGLDESKLKLWTKAKRAFLLTNGETLRREVLDGGQEVIGFLVPDQDFSPTSTIERREFIAISYGELLITEQCKTAPEWVKVMLKSQE
jgi:hypothetical protein